jgi:hypothetical protein
MTVPLAALAPAFAGVSGSAQPSSKVIDAHLAVQATIRSYQVGGWLLAAPSLHYINCISMSRSENQVIALIKRIDTEKSGAC